MLYKILKLSNIHPFVPKLVPGLGSSFKRSCIVEVLKEQNNIITQQSKPIISEIQAKLKKRKIHVENKQLSYPLQSGALHGFQSSGVDQHRWSQFKHVPNELVRLWSNIFTLIITSKRPHFWIYSQHLRALPVDGNSSQSQQTP